MAILLTGGTGFIGSHLARNLIKEGHDIILFDKYINYNRIKDILNSVKIVEGDVNLWNEVVEVISKHDIEDVFHTAAELSVKAEKSHATAFKTNIEGTFNVFEASRILGVKKIIFTSSLSVYGPKSGFPIKENSYRDPTSFYGVTKVFGEIIGMFYHYKHGIDFRCARFPVVIGPGRRGEGATVTFSTLIEKAALNETATIDIPQNTMLPILYIKDAVNFLISLWKAKRVKKRIYIVGGVPISMKELIETLKKYIPNAKINIEIDEEAERVAKIWTLLTTLVVKAGQEKLYRNIEDINWKLKYTSIEEIVKDFIKYVQTHKDMYIGY